MSNVDPPAAPPSKIALVVDAHAGLEAAVAGRRADLEARIKALQGDQTLASVQERDHLTARLSELAYLIKVNVVDGWANVGSIGTARLSRWLAK